MSVRHATRSQKPEARALGVGEMERSARPEARSQKRSRSQKPEARIQKPEARTQKPELRSQKLEGGSQEAEGSSQKAAARNQRASQKPRGRRNEEQRKRVVCHAEWTRLAALSGTHGLTPQARCRGTSSPTPHSLCRTPSHGRRESTFAARTPFGGRRSERLRRKQPCHTGYRLQVTESHWDWLTTFQTPRRTTASPWYSSRPFST